MSRGPGAAQQKILALLAEHEAMTVAEIAAAICRSERQIRRAVVSLERLGYVTIRHMFLGRSGVGVYGRALRKQPQHRDMPTAFTRTPESRSGKVRTFPQEYYLAGMPVHGHVVSLRREILRRDNLGHGGTA